MNRRRQRRQYRPRDSPAPPNLSTLVYAVSKSPSLAAAMAASYRRSNAAAGSFTFCLAESADRAHSALRRSAANMTTRIDRRGGR